MTEKDEYTITVTKTRWTTKESNRWIRETDKYEPDIVDERKDVELYKQTVGSLYLEDVIKAVNGIKG